MSHHMNESAQNDTQKIIDATKKRRNNPRGPRLLNFFQQKANEQSPAAKAMFDLEQILAIMKESQYQKTTCLRKNKPDYNKITNSPRFRAMLKKGAGKHHYMKTLMGGNTGLLNQEGLNAILELEFLSRLCVTLNIQVLDSGERRVFDAINELRSNPCAAVVFRDNMARLNEIPGIDIGDTNRLILRTL